MILTSLKKTSRDIPFPQANNFNTVVSLLNGINEEARMSKVQIGNMINMNQRQSQYYVSALQWMNLATVNRGIVSLTKRGTDIANKTTSKQIKSLAEIVISNPIVNAVMYDRKIDELDFVRYNLESLSTRNRRLSTVKSWVKYFKSVSVDA